MPIIKPLVLKKCNYTEESHDKMTLEFTYCLANKLKAGISKRQVDDEAADYLKMMNSLKPYQFRA